MNQPSDQDALRRDVLSGEEQGAEDEGYEAPATPDQVSMFDLDALTVAAPDADVMQAIDERGDGPAARLRTFEQATIKQMVFFFRGEEYRDAVERMGEVMKQSGTKDHTAAFLWMLRRITEG